MLREGYFDLDPFLNLNFLSNLHLLHLLFFQKRKDQKTRKTNPKATTTHNAKHQRIKTKTAPVSISVFMWMSQTTSKPPRLEAKISVHFPKLLPISTTSSFSSTNCRAKCLGAAIYVSKFGIFLKWYKKWPGWYETNWIWESNFECPWAGPKVGHILI